MSSNDTHDLVLVIIADNFSTITLLMKVFLLLFDDCLELGLGALLEEHLADEAFFKFLSVDPLGFICFRLHVKPSIGGHADLALVFNIDTL